MARTLYDIDRLHLQISGTAIRAAGDTGEVARDYQCVLGQPEEAIPKHLRRLLRPSETGPSASTGVDAV
jgi:hypothetical protein